MTVCALLLAACVGVHAASGADRSGDYSPPSSYADEDGIASAVPRGVRTGRIALFSSLTVKRGFPASTTDTARNRCKLTLLCCAAVPADHKLFVSRYDLIFLSIW